MIRTVCIILLSASLLAACSGRNLNNKLDDARIAPALRSELKKTNPELARPHSIINLTSYNNNVLLVGQTPTAELKAQAEQVAYQIEGVRQVFNEIAVRERVSGIARSNDALLTSKVKSKLLSDGNVPSAKVKVVTENGVVYLLGLVTREQADHITSSVLHVGGVQKIVKLFEYVN